MFTSKIDSDSRFDLILMKLEFEVLASTIDI